MGKHVRFRDLALGHSRFLLHRVWEDGLAMPVCFKVAVWVDDMGERAWGVGTAVRRSVFGPGLRRAECGSFNRHGAKMIENEGLVCRGMVSVEVPSRVQVLVGLIVEAYRNCSWLYRSAEAPVLNVPKWLASVRHGGDV